MEENNEKKVRLNKGDLFVKLMALILAIFMVLSVSATLIYYCINI